MLQSRQYDEVLVVDWIDGTTLLDDDEDRDNTDDRK